VEDQGGAYQTEGEARHDERTQHRGAEHGKDNQGSSPRHASSTPGNPRGVRAGQCFALEDRNVDADEQPRVK
jgi:hypothetical protein